MNEQGYAKIRLKGGKRHAVYADGSAKDGSLYGFPTMCGLRIEEPIDDWEEEDRNLATECGNCRRAAEAHERREAGK